MNQSYLLTSVLSLAVFAATPASAEQIAEFIGTHCASCHGKNKRKGDLRLDELTWNSADEENLEIWQAVMDRVAAGEMPPDGRPQPTNTQRGEFLQHLQEQLARVSEQQIHRVVLRRLNRNQFRNSLRDLLHIDVHVEDPTEAFPADDTEEGFDNLGETLQMSDFLLRQYLQVARTVVDRATFVGDMPEAQTYKMFAERSRPLNFKASGNDADRDYVVLYMNDERAPGDPRGQQLINSREGAERDGWYEFTFDVESLGRGNLPEKLCETNRKDYQVYHPEDLHRFEIYLTAPSKKAAIQTRPRHLVAAIDLEDNKRQLINRRYWVPQGWRVEVAFGNATCANANQLLTTLDPDFDTGVFDRLDTRSRRALESKLVVDMIEETNAPRIVIRAITETGPHYDQWPPASHLQVYGQPGQEVEEHLLDFASRAWRRPATLEQIAPYVRLSEQSPEGIRTAIEAILCSPRFVYMKEAASQLDDYAVASRLSYFLWNTMPDASLLSDAEGGRLRDPRVLTSQVDRMLAHERSDEFVTAFVWAWLRLENTVEMAPDPMKFYDYHRHRLGPSMIEETETFFRYMLTENLPPTRFIDADFAFLNSDLARHYGLPGAVDSKTEFARVALADTGRRGGLLGHMSVLTASANGVDTSPVVRGIWILENLLGTPPSPPPPDVEVPEPDARGELTIRELYAKHRTIQSCNDCHKKIDPLGFALENFDAIGGWRTEYESGHEVDASGRMPGGEEFSDVAGLKQILSSDLTLFTRNLTSKLLTSATGRKMTIADRAEIDAIVNDALRKKRGFRDLLKSVVTSEIFLSK